MRQLWAPTAEHGRTMYVFDFWQLGLVHFGGLFWPTLGTLKVRRKMFGCAEA